MTFFALAPTLAALLNVALMGWVWLRGPETAVRRRFLWWIVWVAFWNAGIAVSYLLPPAAVDRWYHTVVPLTISFLPVFFLHFILALTGEASRLARRGLVVAYVAALGFAIGGTHTHFLIGPTKTHFWGHYPLAGYGAALFGLVWFLTVGGAFVCLIRAIGQARGYRRNQLKYVLLSAVVGFGSGTTNFLPLLGVSVYPVGNLFNSLFSILMAYAIVEYGLMDIRVALRQSAVYGLLSAGLTGVYLSVVSVLEQVFGHYGIHETLVFYTAAVPVTVILAPAMKARLEPWIEKVPFWKTHHYTELLRDFNQSILTLLDLDAAAERILDRMTTVLGTDVGAVYLAPSQQEEMLHLITQGNSGPELLPLDHPIVEALRNGERDWVKERALWNSPKAPEGPLASWPYGIALPLCIKDRLVGLIALGEKTSGDMFNQDDLHLLRAMCHSAAVTLWNAQGIAQLERRQEAMQRQEDLTIAGVLATEMAHELTKPLTRILNAEERLKQGMGGASHDNLAKIERETQRAAEILDSFALLSPSVPLQRRSERVDALIEEALDLLGMKSDPHLAIRRSYTEPLTIPLHRGQMMQVLTNIFQNAWQAMPNGGQLTIHLDRTTKSQQACVRLRVEDSGSGIDPKILGRIFEPFFTTKQTQGGRGVGLPISRAMVERHGGRIEVQSPLTPAGGTRVELLLPIVEASNEA